MLSFLKKLFGFGSTPAVEAPYKMEAPTLNTVEVAVVEAVTVEAPVTESVTPVAAKKPAVKKATAAKKPRVKKAPKA